MKIQEPVLSETFNNPEIFLDGMKPLIKWAGGKSNELKYIKAIIPEFKRYVEPFFGGGALFFALQPKRAIINDTSTELMLFYAFIKGRNPKFKEEIYHYVDYWEKIDKYMEHFGDTFIEAYAKYKQNIITEADFEAEIRALFKDKILPFNGLFSESFCIDRSALLTSIENNVIAKLGRIKNTIDPSNKFSNEEIMKNVESAFRSGFYIHFREIMNRAKKNEINITDQKRVANYYFVREFCYGSMFRFNSEGDFNIPYGGIGYNTKNFRAKVDRLFSGSIKNLMQHAKIYSIDFENLLNKYKLTAKDFLFLDPPYDTEFSDYEENPFTQEDQKRLANYLLETKAKFILIIKETPFILNLYQNKRGIKITNFPKTYLYNVRGRNEREVQHLIVHNIKEPNLTAYL